MRKNTCYVNLPRPYRTLLKAATLALLALRCTGAHTPEATPVFVSGSDGHQSYRIPAIVALSGGDLLAFCEGRVNNAGDFGDINIVMKRSRDGGRTWGSMEVIVDNDTLQAGNPAPVVDLADPRYPDGRIFLFYNTGDNHEGEVRKGNGLREVWYITSHDGGLNWDTPVNITTQVHRPQRPQANPAYDFAEDWRSYANAPGHAMQFTTGKFKGRIFVPANHSAGVPQPQFRDYAAHGYYSDDHGKTFHLGESVDIPGSNESTAAELSDGRLMMNIRNQPGDIRQRIIAISSTGGATWDSVYFDPRLPDPVCEGSLLTVGKRNGKHILAFTNPALPDRRDNLTLRISYDDGETWVTTIPIDRSPVNAPNHAAYSDLVRVDDRRVGILYERNDYKEIVFTLSPWDKQ